MQNGAVSFLALRSQSKFEGKMRSALLGKSSAGGGASSSSVEAVAAAAAASLLLATSGASAATSSSYSALSSSLGRASLSASGGSQGGFAAEGFGGSSRLAPGATADEALSAALLKVIRSPGGAPVDRSTGLEDLQTFVQKLGVSLPQDVAAAVGTTKEEGGGGEGDGEGEGRATAAPGTDTASDLLASIIGARRRAKAGGLVA
jgi:hypothetical protein